MTLRAICLFCVVTVSCTGSQTPGSSSADTRPQVPGLRERGLLLLLADRRIYEGYAVSRMARQNNLEIRQNLAVTLGHIGDDRGRVELELMLSDSHPELRRASAFGLGQLGLSASWPSLLAAVRGADVETSVWAVDALARSGADLREVLKVLDGMSASQVWPRILPYLFRFPPEETVAVAQQALTLESPHLHAMAVYALARQPTLTATPLLRPLLSDPDPWSRGWAARALGQLGTDRDVEEMRHLLDDEQPGPIIQALRSSHRLISLGRSAPPAGWQPRILELMDDPRPGVALTATEASAAWLLDRDISQRLESYVIAGPDRYREVALTALAQGGDPRGLDLAYRFAISESPKQRALAASTLTTIGDYEIAVELLGDAIAEVRLAALDALLESEFSDRATFALQALEDADPAVRGSALGWFALNPVASTEDLSRALVDIRHLDIIELRLNGINALVARGREEPLERGLVIRNLESLAEIGAFPARRAAAEGLVEFDRPSPPIGPADTRKTAVSYENILLVMDEQRVVEIATRHGLIQLRLECPTTPMTCVNFLQLTNQGFFDGLEFHRVVPDFVVQGGDPRGDGWGGPGYTIRDELNRMPFERGVIGMASEGPDTAGSQFFIALSRQPHLDGLYTSFGRVTHGMEVLDEIVQGDRMVTVTEIGK